MKDRQLHNNRRKLAPRSLEPRRLLNAEFVFNAGPDILSLTNFTNDNAGIDQVEVAQVGMTTTFTLTDGTWAGMDAAGVTGDGLATLTVDTALLNLVEFINNSGDQFDIQFDDLALSSTDISIDGTTSFGLVSQTMGSQLEVDDFTFRSAENICLTNAGNDFTTIDVTGATNIEIVDANDLTVTQAVATDQIWLAAGDSDATPGDGTDGLLTLNGNITSDAVLLQASEGVSQSAGIIMTTDLLLGGDEAKENSGTFDLQQANEVDVVSASLSETLQLNSSTSIEFGAGVFDSFCDDPGGNPDTETFTDVNIGNDLSLNVTGDVTQSTTVIVGDVATINAIGDICLTDPTNDFGGEVSATGDTVELVDANALDVGVVTAVNDIYLRSGATAAGALTLNGNLTTTDAAGQILLQSDSGVMQLAGVITTNDLLLGGNDADEGSGNFDLGGNNVVNNLAAALQDDLTFVNTVSLDIADLMYASSCGTMEAITGVDVGGNLDLDVNGDITQTAIVVVAGTSALTATGDICLVNVGNDFVGQVTASGDTVELVDANALDVGVVTAVNDIYLRSGATAAGALTLNGNLTTTDAAGQILLQSDSGVMQLAGVITTNDLLVGGNDADEGSGNFDLGGNNVVNNIAAALQDDLTFVNTVSLDIADLMYASSCGTMEAITGVDVGGNLDLDVTGDITQTAIVVVAGTSALTATGDICLVNAGNDFVGQVTASADTVELVDANALDVGVVTAVNDIYLRSGATAAGALTLNGNLTTTDAAGQILLQSDSGVMQLAGVITTNDLLLGGNDADEGSGNFDLGGNNVVNNLAAALQDDLTFVNTVSLDIADLMYASSCGTMEAITGVDVGGNLDLDVTGDITQTAIVVVAGTSALTATGDICLVNAGNDFVGQVTASGDTVELVDANALDVGVVTAVNDIYLRSGATAAGSLTLNGNLTTTDAAGQILLQSDSGVMQLVGVITTNDLLLGGNDADEGSGNFDLGGNNVVNNIAAALQDDLTFVNTVSLDIADLMYASSCGTMEAITGVDVGGNLDLDVTGDITQTAVVTVAGTSALTASGTICLTDPANDFVGQVTASGDTVELVDANALDVGVVTAVNNIYLRSGATAAGALTLNGNLTTTDAAGQILLQSDSGVMQLAGVITTNDLLLGGNDADEGSGNFDLGGNNGVNNLAAALQDDLTLVNTVSLDIADLMYASSCGTAEAITGVDVGGNLDLDVTGDITQTAIVVVAGTSALTATGDICLVNAGNDFVGQVTASGDTVELVDANALDVGVVTAVNDIYLRSGATAAGALTLNGNLTTTDAAGQILLQSDSGVMQLAGVITTNDLLLGGNDADEASGNFDLGGNNVVNNLAAALQDDLTFVNTVSLDIADLLYASSCGTMEAITGVDVGGNLDLDVTGDITQTAIVVVAGTSALTATGDICLVNAGNDFVGQVTASGDTVELVDANALDIGVVTAVNDIYLRSGATAAGALTLNGNLTTTDAAGQILLQSDSGVMQLAGVITTNELLLGGNDADEGSGNFDLGGNNVVNNIAAALQDDLTFVNTSDLDIADLDYISSCGTMEAICGIDVLGNLSIDTVGDITQTAAVIVGGNAIFTATDDICLTGGDCDGDGLNDNAFGGTIDLNAGGETVFATTGNLTLTAALVSSGGNLRFIADSIDIQTDVVADQLLLESGNGVTLDDLFMLDVTDLLLSGTGTFDIFTAAANQIDNLAADIDGDLDLNNSTDLTIDKITFISDCGNVQIDGVTITGNAAITIVGNLNQTNAPVIVGGATTLDVTGDICLIDGDCNADGNTDNDFNTLEIVNATNAEVLDANDLIVTSATVTGQLWLASGNADATPGDGVDGAMTLNGNVTAGTQALLQASEGITQAGGVITVDQLLLGGDLAKESTGDFILNGANVVDELAATLIDSLEFTNTVNLAIVKDTYTSICDPMISEPFLGLDIGGDLTIVVTGGDLSQAIAPVIVDGATVLDVSGDICLIGGDCDLDGNTDNDFNTLEIVNATNAEVLDANDLIVTSATVTGQLWLASGNADATPGDGVDGAMTLNGNVTAGTQALLQASEGITQAGGVITVDQLLLGGDLAKESTGDFILNGANVVDELAATLIDSLEFTNTVNLAIVKDTYTSICDPMISEPFLGLDIGGDLTIVVTGGDLSQTIAPVIVDGATVLDVSGDICLIGGDCDLDGNTDNDFNSLEIVNAANAEVLDANDLVVTSATVTGQLWLAAGNADATPGDGVDGAMTLNGNVTAGTQALLQASEGITQAGGVITVNQLLLGGDLAKESTGDFILNGANVVDELAATLVDNLEFTNTVNLMIVKDTYTSICDPMISEPFLGLDIGGDLTIVVTGGDLSQTIAPVVVDGATVLDVSGDICLIGGDCDLDGNTDNDFNTLEIVNATNAEVLDANDLVVTSATVTGQLWLAAGNADATPGDGVDGAMTLNGNVTAGTQALLQASEGITQAGGVITVDQLLLGGDLAKESTGDFILNGANIVDELAATLIDNLEFTNTVNLTIIKDTYTSICDPMISEPFLGLDIGGDLTIVVTGGDLSQTIAPVVVDGATVLDVTGDICLIGGDCDLDGNTDNDFNTLEIVNATNAEVLDANDLVVTSATVTGQLWLAAGNADATPGDGVDGAMTLNGNVIAGTQALLQASEGITQAAGVITVDQLLLGGDLAKESTGAFILNGANVVDELAATLIDNLEFTNTVNLMIVKDTYTSICDPMISEPFLGLDIGGDLTIFVIGGDLSQTIAPVIVDGATVLDVTGDICLIGGDCDLDGNTDNDFNTLEIVNAANAEVLDANDLIVTSVTVTGQLWLAAGNADATPGDGVDGAMTLNGNVTAGTQALLQASEGITQAGGVITVDQLLLGGDLAKESTGDFILNGANVVDELAATLIDNLEFTNTVNLTIVKDTYTSICDPMISEPFLGLDIGGDLTIVITGGDLSQTIAPVIVDGATVLDVTGDICLIGGDCDLDGNTDNDFNTLEIVNATNAEVLDTNDLVVNGVNVTNQLWLAAGNADATSGDGVDGAMTLNGNVTAGTQALLQASEGITQAGGVITVDQLLLGGDLAKESTGDFILTGANVVDELAATLIDNLEFTNTVNLTIVKDTYTSICDPMISEPFLGLDIGGDLTIVVSGGDLSQTIAPVIVDGATVLDVTGDICLIGGDCDLDGNTDNDFNTLEIVNATNAEILDANDLIVNGAMVSDQLRLVAGDADATPADGTGGTLTLAGDVIVTNKALLQASEGVSQTGGVIEVDQLLLGGDLASEGAGEFTLLGENRISQLAGELIMGTLQLNNTVALEVINLEYESVCSAFTEQLSRLYVGADGVNLEAALDGELVDLSGTLQALDANGDGFSDHNANFFEYLTGMGLDSSGTASDIGIAIFNDGLFQNSVEMTAFQSDILVQTNGTSDLNVGPFGPNASPPAGLDANIRVSNANHILLIAGGNLQLDAELIRGGEGTVIDELNINPNPLYLFDDGNGFFDLAGMDQYFMLLDPGVLSNINALVDTTNLTQDFQIIFGSAGEQNYDLTVYWGIQGNANNGAIPFLTPDILSQFITLIDTGFESQSFYLDATDNLINAGIDPSFGDIAYLLRSLPINAMDPASFTIEFLRDNPEFRNLAFVFNDAQINIFENAGDGSGVAGDGDFTGNGISDGLVDLNVAAEEFIGLARIGTPPVIIIDRPEFQLPTRVEMTQPIEFETVQNVFIPDEINVVPTVREKFFVVVYFENQADADLFVNLFGDGEQDFAEKIRKLLKDKDNAEGYDNVRWETDTDDVNRIRVILEGAGLDLEDSEDLLEQLETWIKQGDEEGQPNIPRGIYKIIVVEDGQALIQGDDIDRRFVPEKIEDSDNDFEVDEIEKDIEEDDFEYLDDKSSSNGLNSDGFDSGRIARWNAILAGDNTEISHTELQSEFETANTPVASVAAATSLLGLVLGRRAAGSANAESAASSQRNLFSRASRFSRRFRNHKSQ